MKFPSCLVGTSLALVVAQLSVLRCCWAHREHKVHNIVLYPDKESWCKTTPIKQVVTWPQCSSQELDNNVCVGACFSYMVPHSEPSAPGDHIRPYCDSCQPLDSTWQTVTLDCKDKDGNLSTMQKKVQIITNCSCTSCTELARPKPDLTNLVLSLEHEASKHHPHQPLLSIPQLSSTSLNSDQTEESEKEEEDNGTQETPDLLLDPNLNATSKASALPSEKSAERLQRLVDQLTKEPQMATEELASTLIKFNELKDYPGSEALLEKLSRLLKKYGSENDSVEEGLISEKTSEAYETSSVESLSLSSSELPIEEPVSPEIKNPPPPVEQEEPQIPSLQDEQDRVAAELMQRHHHHHHHHHNGPHHSMVLEADGPPGVKEKIDVESKYLQPAVPGQEISYHDSVREKPKEKDF